MKRLTNLLSAFGLILLFCACGQSGPLYIPGNPSQLSVPPAEDAAEEKPEQGEPREAAQ